MDPKVWTLVQSQPSREQKIVRTAVTQSTAAMKPYLLGSDTQKSSGLRT